VRAIPHNVSKSDSHVWYILKGYNYLPGLICCFFTEASSTWVLSAEPCLKTTGPLEIEAADVVFDDDAGSKRFAYKERPPARGGLGAEELDILERRR
jgi:hypothetical protein